VTYPDNQVAGMLNEHFVPVQVDIEKVSKLVDRFQALWTPNLNVIDGREKLIYKVVGWLPPSEFAAMLQTARGHFLLLHKKFDEAAPVFKSVFENFPRSHVAAECLYHRGVSRYLSSHDVKHLKEDWGELQRFLPGSQWTMKANIL
jgi:hypothetical protein